MNDRSFRIVEENVAQRRRRLNALAGAQVGGLITMTLTLAHLIAVFLGVMALLQPWWWLVVGNVAALAMGGLVGRRRAVHLKQDLYRLDRRYALGEKLTTIHEIRQRDDRSPYLRLLYGRIGDRDLSPKRALRPTRRQRRAWAALSGVTMASAALLAMWFVGVPPLSVPSLLASGPGNDQPVVASQNQASDDPVSEASSAGESASTDPRGQRTDTPCKDQNDSVSPSMLTREAREDCQPSSSSPSGDGRSSTGSQGTSQSASQDGRMSVQQLRRQLQSVQQQMAAGDLSMADAQRELEQLSQEARSPSMEELLEQAAQSDSRKEMRQRMQNAMDELDRRRAQAQRSGDRSGPRSSSDGQRRSGGEARGTQQGQAEGQEPSSEPSSQREDPQQSQRDGEGQPESQQADGPQRSERGSGPNPSDEGSDAQAGQQESTSSSDQRASAQRSQNQGESAEGPDGEPSPSGNQGGNPSGNAQSEGQSGEGEGSSNSSQDSSGQSGNTQGSDEGNADSRSQGEREGTGTPGGSSPGTGTGESAQGQSGDVDGDSANNLRIESSDLPTDMETLRAMMTQGVPFNVSGSPTSTGSPQLELNPDRVETLLRSRDLPPEVRDLVRAYFLSLAEGE